MSWKKMLLLSGTRVPTATVDRRNFSHRWRKWSTGSKMRRKVSNTSHHFIISSKISYCALQIFCASGLNNFLTLPFLQRTTRTKMRSKTFQDILEHSSSSLGTNFCSSIGIHTRQNYFKCLMEKGLFICSLFRTVLYK